MMVNYFQDMMFQLLNSDYLLFFLNIVLNKNKIPLSDPYNEQNLTGLRTSWDWGKNTYAQIPF